MSNARLNATRQANVTGALFTWLVASLLPSSILDDPNFKNFVHAIDSRVVVPASDQFKTWLMAQENSTHERLSKEFQRAKGISFTCDYWSKFQRAFLGITAHMIAPLLITDEITGAQTCMLVCKKFFLALIPVSEKHTAEHTDELVSDAIHTKLGFATKIKTGGMTTDNGSNVKKFASSSKFFRWVSCFAHSLQLFVRAGLNFKPVNNSTLLAKVRSLAEKFRNTPEYTRRLLAACKDKPDLKFKRAIIENTTRWNTTLHMAARLLHLKAAIRSVFSTWANEEKDERIELEDLTPEQWLDLQGMVDELAILESMTIAVQESNKPTISHIRHFIEHIREKLLPDNDNDSTVLHNMRQGWRAAFDIKFAPYFDGGTFDWSTVLFQSKCD